MSFRDAWCGVRGGRGTTVFAFSVLALAMAAATVTLAVVDGIVLRPLPYGAPDRLVSLGLPSQTPWRLQPPTPQHFFAWLEGTEAFESLGAARTSSLQLDIDGVVEPLSTRRITVNLFDVLGVRPAVGRFFGPEHEQAGRDDIVILSHDLWRRRFAADPSVIGRWLRFEDGARQVVGVLPAGVWYPIILSAPPDLYVPYVPTAGERALDGPWQGTIFVVGRLRPGIGVEQARADLNRIASGMVVPIHDEVVGPARKWLLLALAAVGLMLLVACVNLAILLLARATARVPEFTIREALGASRRQLAVSLLFEGLLLALAAAGAGLVLGVWGVEAVKGLLPPEVRRVSEVGVDVRVLAASIVVAFVCGLLLASAPAWLVRRSDLTAAMRAGDGAVAGDRRRRRLLSTFLVADAAFVSLLLVATTLVVTTFIIITTADLGFDRRNLLFLWYQRPVADIGESDRLSAVRAIHGELLERARSVPGVGGAALLNSGTPLSGTRQGARLVIPGYGETSGFQIQSRRVSPDYFAVMGIGLVRGRLFRHTDRDGGPRVMIISDVTARRYFLDRDPVGEVITFGGAPTTIVGVVRGTYSDGPEVEMPAELYAPLDQGRSVIHTYQDLTARLRSEVWSYARTGTPGHWNLSSATLFGRHSAGWSRRRCD